MIFLKSFFLHLCLLLKFSFILFLTASIPISSSALPQNVRVCQRGFSNGVVFVEFVEKHLEESLAERMGAGATWKERISHSTKKWSKIEIIV